LLTGAALVLAVSAACDGTATLEAADRAIGHVDLALSHTDAGDTYRFIGSLQVRDASDQVVATVVADDMSDPNQIVTVPIGTHTLTLVGGTFGEVLLDDGTAPYCTFQGSGGSDFTGCTVQDPGSFVVRADQTTDVVIPILAHFEEPDVDELFSEGDVQIELGVEDGDGTCAGVFCSNGETCAVVNGEGPACTATCQEDDDCPAEFKCVGASGSIPMALCIALDPRWLQIAAGDAHSCAIASNREVYCWGSGTDGRLGNGATIQSNLPVLVLGLTDVVEISAGAAHSCAVKGDGTAYCWGSGLNGRLGDGTTTSSSVPVQVSNLTTFTDISAGSQHTCAIVADGTAYCWGNGGGGRLGQGATMSSSVPVQVSGLSDVAQISAGSAHTCAVTTGSSAHCWGTGTNGRLGNGGTASSSVAVQVTGLTSGVNSIGAGTSHSCATLTTGGVRCWGNGATGRLGDGTTNSSSVPVTVVGITNAARVSAGSAHNCALTSNKRVLCWGEGASGRLGNGSAAASSVPVEVQHLRLAESAVAAAAHSCALIHEGFAYCWGEGGNGRLGNSSTTDFSYPIPVPRPDL
jgi:alpha-tubulin suppressor-like RCC1 family protein